MTVAVAVVVVVVAVVVAAVIEQVSVATLHNSGASNSRKEATGDGGSDKRKTFSACFSNCL